MYQEAVVLLDLSDTPVSALPQGVNERYTIWHRRIVAYPTECFHS